MSGPPEPISSPSPHPTPLPPPTILTHARPRIPRQVATHHPRLVWRVPQLACCAQGAGCLQSAYSLEFYTANGTVCLIRP